MVIRAFTCIAFLCAWLAASAETGLVVVRPEKSPLKLAAVTDHGLTARFSGAITIDGVFVARWAAPDDEKNADELLFSLYPTAEFKRSLPHFANPPSSSYRWSYEPGVIDVANAEATLRKLVGRDRAERLLKRKIERIELVGSFKISAYEVGVECDSPWARAEIDRYLPVKRVITANTDVARC
jgi:hypothetical protein